MEADKTSHKGTESEINISRYASVYSLPVGGPLCQFLHILFWLHIITREVNRHAPFDIHIAGNDIHIAVHLQNRHFPVSSSIRNNPTCTIER